MTKQHKEIKVSELAARLAATVTEAEGGATFTITRRGVPIAVIGPIPDKASSVGAPELLVEEPGATYRVGDDEMTRPTTWEHPSALARMIGNPTTRSVMETVLRSPHAPVYQREIARRADVGLRSAQLALDKLEKLGLVEAERDGNRLYYRVRWSEGAEELRSLLLREMGPAEVIARHLATLDEPIRWACVFGSAASGEDKLGSDIDLLVVTEATADQLVEPIASAQRELKREIDVVNYTPDEFARKRTEGNHFIRAVLAGQRYDVIGGLDGI